MTRMRTLKIVVAIFAVLAICLFIFLNESKPASASAPLGLVATVATSSTRVVGPSTAYNAILGDYMGTTTNETLTPCDSRIISTTGGAIMISFGSLASTSLSGSQGSYQAPSTTVAYDSGLYGCGYWLFYAYASTTITISETR